MHKRFIFFVLIILLFLFLGCASLPTPPADNNYREISIVEFDSIRYQIGRGDIAKPTNGFVVNATISAVNVIDKNILISNYLDNLTLRLHGNTIDCQNNHNCTNLVEIYNDYADLRRRAEGKKVDIYFSYFDDRLYVNKIEGLLTDAEVAEIQRDSETEARRLAIEEANRYDPEKFIILPRNFTPSIYKSMDLFDAVAEVEFWLSYGKRDNTTNFYVSDVVFVNQTGTSITFITDYNAISQTMSIDSRSELTSGQRVRLFYGVTFNILPVWNVRAIERF